MKLNICLISVVALAAAATTVPREAPAADMPQIDLVLLSHLGESVGRI